MKKTFLIVTLCVSTFLFSQHSEISIGVNSGLFSFTGISAVDHSNINASDFSNGYTNNPYGTKSGLAFGISWDYKYVFKNNLLLGANLGYENLKSKVNIDQVLYAVGIAPPFYIFSSASGKTNLVFNNINFFPYLGYRVSANQIHFDVSAGADVAFILSAKEKGSATTITDNTNYETSVDRKTISTDFRPRLQLNAQYKKYGLYIGYSFGTVNYMKDYVGLGDYEAKSRMLRFGLTYQLK